MAGRLHLSGVVDVDFLILRMLPHPLAPLVRTVCSSWASAIPRYGLSADRDDDDYVADDLALYLAGQGCLHSLMWICQCDAPFGLVVSFLSRLIMHGKPEYLEWALDVSGRFQRITEEDAVFVCNLIAHQGKLDLLDWALSRKDFGRPAMVEISQHGCAAAISWALKRGVSCSSGAYASVVMSNDVNLLDSLWNHEVLLPARNPYCVFDATLPESVAAETGNIAALRWLNSKTTYHIDRRSATEFAASAGHMEVLHWLADNNLLYTEDVGPCVGAARSNHQEILRWLHYDRRCPWDSTVADAAAENGHLLLLCWLCSQNCPYDVHRVMNRGIWGGCIHIMEWAMTNGGLWDQHALLQAALYGRLEALRWCRAHGARWDEHICSIVCRAGQNVVLRWLLSEEGGARELLDETCIWVASLNGHLRTVKILVGAGCPMGADAIRFALANRHFKVVDFLHGKGCPLPDTKSTIDHTPTSASGLTTVSDWPYSD